MTMRLLFFNGYSVGWEATESAEGNEIPAEDLAAGEGGGHGDAEETVEVEALAGEKEVIQRGARRKDSAQRGFPIMSDAESGALGCESVAGICQRGAGVGPLNAVFQPRQSLFYQAKALLEFLTLCLFIGFALNHGKRHRTHQIKMRHTIMRLRIKIDHNRLGG